MSKEKTLSDKELVQELKPINIFLWAFVTSAIILLIDIYDVPSSVINTIPMDAMVVYVCLFLAIVALVIYNTHFWDLCMLPYINMIDKASIYALTASVICTYAWRFWYIQYAYKGIISLILCILFESVLICRYLYLKKLGKQELNQKKIYDIKEIYEGKIKKHSQTPLLVSEKEVSYDLLNRNGIINQLYNSIISYEFDPSFVIGLEGPWGSGKTTIIENVKSKLSKDKEKQKELVIIDDFDPWEFGTQYALLVAMYDSILKKTNVKYSVNREKKLIKSLSNTLVDYYNAGSIIQDLFFPQRDAYGEVKDIKENLKQYIKSENLRIVFFIDNMDRAEGDNIIFLFKLIGTIFNLPNTVYVLSYDRERLNEILKDTEKINPKYVEKIINQVITVPVIEKELLWDVYGICINNILKYYGMTDDEISKLQVLKETIYANVKDLRMFKRMINSTFASVFCHDNFLYKNDLLGLEIIRFLQPELYTQISENKAFFVSHDRIIDQNLYFEWFDNEKFNSDGKIFFERLFNEYGEYKKLLAEMFPYVQRFVNKSELKPKYPNYDSDYNEISRNTRICSGKYFDLYFSYGSNEYLRLGKEISNMVNDIIRTENICQLYDNMCNTIANIPDYIQREWFERLESYLTLIPAEKKIVIARVIFDCIGKIDSSQVFMGLEARRRALLNVELLLEGAELNAVRDFVESMTYEYGKLEVIDQILYWFAGSRSQHRNDVKIRESILKAKFSEMCEKVLEKCINLYEDPYYIQHNIWGLIRYLKIKENREEIVHDYIAQIIDEKIVFRIMGDTISQSMGTGYGYRIDESNFKLFFEDESMVDSLLKKAVPKTESERFVLDVYHKYKSDEKNDWGEKEIFSKHEIKLIL